mmetsp:Transcript_10230/g.21321  ORF Transcript_10230/g.21321 Transcript_10230/m.21321 type:complete len:288 (-) Transcript_10230:523-1386(-)
MGCLNFHSFCISNELLKHTDDTKAGGLLFVVLELRLTCFAFLGLNECRRLDVELLQGSTRFLQELLGLPLLHDHALELLVFLLAVLAGHLRLLVHFGYLVLQRLDVGTELCNLALEGFQLCQLLLFRVGLVLCLQFCFLQLIDTPILLLNFSSLLLLQISLHFINGLLHLLKAIQLHGQGQGGQAGIQFPPSSSQHSCSTVLAIVVGRHLQKGEGLAENIMRLICSQDLNGLADRSLLLRSQLAALVVLRVHDRTLLLDLGTDSAICFQGGSGVSDVLLALLLLQVC